MPLEGCCGRRWPCRHRRRGRSSSDDVRVSLHWFTLTFTDPRTEREFLRHTREQLRLSCLRFSLVGLGIVLGAILILSVWDYKYSYRDGYMDQMLVCATIGSLFFFNAVVSQVECLFDKIKTELVEVYLVVTALAAIVAVIGATTQYMARLKGEPLPEHSNDAGILLLLTSVAMGLHLLCHIRWHALIPVQVGCVLGYALPAFVLGGPHEAGEALLRTIELAGLVLCASQGKRMIQAAERQNFVHLIAERTRRVTTEFQLSQMKHTRPANNAEDIKSVPESVPTTTDTGRVFQIGFDVEAGQLDGVLEIGQKEQWLVEAVDLSWSAEQILGVGSFGIVVRGQYQGVGVAVKVPKAAPHALRSKSCLPELCNELQILRRLRHPNIVVFYGAWLDEHLNDLAIVMELVEGVPLREFARSGAGASDRAQVTSQIGCAIRYLHTRHPRIVHGDLKDSNIFIEGSRGSFVAKLLDFGLSRRITKNARPMGGSILWVAPEVILGNRNPDTASDVFSFGRVIYFIATGTRFGEGKNPECLVADLRSGNVVAMHYPQGFAIEYKPIVDRCSQASHARPDICQVHDELVRIWANYGGQAVPLQDGTEADLQRALRVVRQAAAEWRAKPRAWSAQATRRGSQSLGSTSHRPSLISLCEDTATAVGVQELDAVAARLYPGLALTPVKTQGEFLTPVLVRCNFSMNPRACCSLHASVENLQNLLRLLGAKPCMDLAGPVAGQCPRCGIVVTETDVSMCLVGAGAAHQCDVCGEVVPL